jgi:DNA-directed RNA polymerase specialized sigma24 family protein
MGDEQQLPPENGIVSARMRGAMSVDGSFERLYRMYAPVVIGWLAVRVEAYAVDDLLQDVWTVFYGRWRSWQQPAELDTPEARPVLSFLFRTVHLATKAHRRARRVHEQIEEHDLTDDRTMPERLIAGLTLASCLDFAKTHCGEEDVAVLTGKLAGISAKEIARTLEISESAVDHRYRNTLGYLRQHLQSAESGGIR